jgi:hypothetical protein
MNYSDMQAWFRQHPLRQSEIPTEHVVSLPLPTLRWGEAAYVYFAGPAERRSGEPSRHGPPDRWWAFRGRGGQVLFYALSRIFSLAPAGWAAASPAPAAESVIKLQQMVRDIEQMMNVVVPDFFEGAPGDALVREALAGVMTRFLGPPLLEFYAALAPDFFGWLQPGPPARS